MSILNFFGETDQTVRLTQRNEELALERQAEPAGWSHDDTR